ncbi:MAG TPA: HYR domain-containing protein [Pyrinomonadaceae bacterium]
MRRLFGPISHYGTFLALFLIVLATALYSGASASGNRQSNSAAAGKGKVARNISSKKISNLPGTKGTTTITNSASEFLMSAAPVDPGDETVTTYAADCTTPKSKFHLGDTVCAKIDGGPLLEFYPRRFSWVDNSNVIRQLSNVTNLPQTNLFTIPAHDPDVDYRGEWSVDSISQRASIRAGTVFTVSDPNDETADLVVYNNINTDTDNVAAGSNIEFAVWLVNRGPDDATNVQLSDAVASDATFVSATQDSGAPFTCTPAGTGGANCTIPTLASGESARIRFIFQTNGGASAGTAISNTATISSATAEQKSLDNTSLAQLAITGNNGGTFCSLSCPGNIIKTADATQGGDSGAFVTFGTGDVSGDCGTVTSDKPSGSFFPVGETTVTISSSTGESCTFLVIVTDTPPPTIACPTGVQKDAGTDCSVTLTDADLGTPTTTGDNVTVDGQRNDGAALDAPYPIGTTTITWKATDSFFRSVTCTQTVTVTGSDTTPPTITAPPDVTDNTGAAGAACGKIVGETELGAATADDNCTVHVTRTGVPAGNFFPVGTTTVTYTATDGSGNTATATQHVTITENTPPIILAPADASYTCPSEVPAADPSQAHGDDPNLPNGGPVTDNCGVPTVTVSETRSGAGSTSSPLVILRTFTATDASGNSASATQTITVTDPTPPTITAPAAVTAYTGANATSCSAVVSDAQLGSATASDNCGTATVTRSPSGNTFAVGDTTITWTATDAAGNTATATQIVTVVDNTPPTLTTPPNVVADTAADATSCSTVVSDAMLGTASAGDNCGSVGTITRSGVPAGNIFPVGTTTITYSVTDSHGNTSSAQQTVTVRDKTPPVVTPPPNITVYLPLHTTATSMAVSYPTPATAMDNCDGAIPASSISYSPASGSTFSVGTTTVTVSATDSHGNVGTATFTVTVLYDFTGFFSPVSNTPTLNVVNAGRAIPVKFSLSGNKGLGIFSANSPQSGVITCDASAPAIDLTDTVTAGGSSLSYDATSDQYDYVWKTDSSWAGTCRQLVVTLNDGTQHVANFKFK